MVCGSTTAIGSEAGPILAVQDGCSAVSASSATQSRISSSVLTPGPGEISPPSNGCMAGWLRMSRATRDGLGPLPPVLLGRQVVEPQRRVPVGSVEVIWTVPRASEYIGPMCTW